MSDQNGPEAHRDMQVEVDPPPASCEIHFQRALPISYARATRSPCRWRSATTGTRRPPRSTCGPVPGCSISRVSCNSWTTSSQLRVLGNSPRTLPSFGSQANLMRLRPCSTATKVASSSVGASTETMWLRWVGGFQIVDHRRDVRSGCLVSDLLPWLQPAKAAPTPDEIPESIR